jgi:NAD(P)-dependent dehydrogenase (short-subunit alcohol dehydrogenase family)
MPAMISFGLEGKRAVVSGAGYIPGRGGLGRATSLALASAGAKVACIDIDQHRAAAIAGEIERIGGEAFPVVADMTVSKEAGRAVSMAAERLGGLDACVDIIGGPTLSRAEEYSDEEWASDIHLNLTQVFYLFRAVGHIMIRQGTGGAMVALASVDGTTGAPYHAPYSAAKAGVIALAKTLADEFGRYGIRVNIVAPGNVGTGNEDQRDGDWAVNGINTLAAPRSRDIGNAVLFLASDLAARITGQTLIVDGGATIKGLWPLSPEELESHRGRY